MGNLHRSAMEGKVQRRRQTYNSGPADPAMGRREIDGLCKKIESERSDLEPRADGSYRQQVGDWGILAILWRLPALNEAPAKKRSDPAHRDRNS